MKSIILLAASAFTSPVVVDSTAAVGGVGPFGYAGSYRNIGVVSGDPSMINSDRIHGGPGRDDIDDRDIQINTGGQDSMLTHPWRHRFGCAGVTPIPTWCNRRYPFNPYMRSIYGYGAYDALGLDSFNDYDLGIAPFDSWGVNSVNDYALGYGVYDNLGLGYPVYNDLVNDQII